MELTKKSCGRLGCYSDWGATVVVGHTKWETNKQTGTFTVNTLPITSPPLSSAPLQVWSCIKTEASALRWLGGEKNGGPKGSVHTIQPCTKLVQHRDPAHWAEPHRHPASLSHSPVSQSVSHSCCVGLCSYGVPGKTFHHLLSPVTRTKVPQY